MNGERAFRALVTGAAGYVGSHICKELINRGCDVVGLVRRTSDLSNLPPNVRVVYGDIKHRDEVMKAFSEAGKIDLVYHIAALFREAKHNDEEYYKVNEEGVRNVIIASIEHKVRRVVHCSTGGVHGHISNPPADEEAPFSPGDVYQLSKLRGEEVARSYFQDGLIHGVIIRPAMIWGCGDRRTFKLFEGIRRRRLPIIGDGKTLVHWVNVEDLARAFYYAGTKDVPSGEVFIIAGDRPVTMEYMFHEIAKAFNTTVLPLKLPVTPIKCVASIVEKICVPIGIEPPIYRRRVDFFTKSRAFDCSKAKRLLGYEPTRTFEQDVRYIAEYWRSVTVA